MRRTGRASAGLSPRLADDDHIRVRLGGEQARAVGCTPLQREALVDVALVGDFVRVNRWRVGEQQYAGDALGRARVCGVPVYKAAADVLADRRMSGKKIGRAHV